jgi:hypothetical protein
MKMRTEGVVVEGGRENWLFRFDGFDRREASVKLRS